MGHVPVALPEDGAARQLRILVLGAVDAAAQFKLQTVEALRRAHRSPERRDERPLRDRRVQFRAAGALRVETVMTLDIEFGVARGVEPQPKRALSLGPVGA